MPCKKYRYSASAFIDRELRKREAAEYAFHLAKCADCSMTLRETEGLSRILRHTAQSQPPRDLHWRIMKAVRELGSQPLSSRGLSGQSARRSVVVKSWLAPYGIGVVASLLLFALT
ncbi:MAG: zf-HC2 domain-containing protein, partial [Blastocatellia bacterium]